MILERIGCNVTRDHTHRMYHAETKVEGRMGDRGECRGGLLV